jgi:hypothetical protein
VRDSPTRRIGLVFFNYSEGLLAAVVADDRDRITETNDGIVSLLGHQIVFGIGTNLAVSRSLRRSSGRPRTALSLSALGIGTSRIGVSSGSSGVCSSSLIWLDLQPEFDRAKAVEGDKPNDQGCEKQANRGRRDRGEARLDLLRYGGALVRRRKDGQIAAMLFDSPDQAASARSGRVLSKVALAELRSASLTMKYSCQPGVPSSPEYAQ